jgi:hypothetical protein
MPQVYNPDGTRIGDALNPLMSATAKDPSLAWSPRTTTSACSIRLAVEPS